MVRFRIQLNEDYLGHQRAVDINFDGEKLSYERYYLSHCFESNRNDVTKMLIQHGIDTVEMTVNNSNILRMSIGDFVNLWCDEESRVISILSMYERLSVTV